MALGLNFGNPSVVGDGESILSAFTKINDMFSKTTAFGNGDLSINDVKIGRGDEPGSTAVGNLALQGNTPFGTNNTAVGWSALTTNGVGDNNVAVGAKALELSTANANTAVGAQSLSNNQGHSNCIGIGYNAQVDDSNQIVLGNSSNSVLKCNVQTITSLSDERDKTDIVEITEGLEFVNKLKPVTFTWNQRDEGRIGIKSAGFIAQDLLELQNDSLIGENLDLVSENDPERLQARYGNLLPVMIKAIQELTARINVLEGN